MSKHLAQLTRAALVFVLTAGFAVAQTGTITGLITDAESGEPLPGANVVVTDLQATGGTTGPDGRYSIPGIPVRSQPYTVQASFIGYNTVRQTVSVEQAGQTITVNFTLSSGVQLGDVVVTALGIERDRRSLGYATQEVDSELLQRANESNLVNALAGKVAGVQVTSSSGQPGAGARIVIRGNSSFTGDNQPLFVVDGVPISNAQDTNQGGNAVFTGGTSNRAVDIDPAIIEDVTVLKGAAAMALYGSRAANGAVVITTRGSRAGRQQAPRLSFNSTVRWDNAIIDGYQLEYAQGNFGCFHNGLPADAGGFNDQACYIAQERTPPANPAAGQIARAWGPRISDLNQNAELLARLGVDAVEARDPRRDFFQTGGTTENNLSLQGSILNGNYFVSMSRLDQDGIVPGTLFDRTSLLARFGAALSDQLRVESSINYINSQNQWVNEGNGALSYLFSLAYTPPTYNIRQTGTDGNILNRTFAAGFNNPIWLSENNGYTSDVDRYIGNVSVSYRFLPWLTVSERLGIDSYTDRRKGKVNVGSAGRPAGSMYDQTITRREINSDLVAQVTRQQFGPIGLDALVGNNLNYRDFDNYVLSGTQLGIPGFFHINNTASQTTGQSSSRRAIVGVYSQATVDYDDWAYLTLTGRNDWSSTLPRENNSYFYPSAALSLILSEAIPFLREVQPLDLARVRSSIARIGNDAPVYSTSTSFVQTASGDGVRGVINFPFQGVNAYNLSNVLGNPTLRPELSTEYEFGLELQGLQNRIRFDAAYYNRTTQDQIFSVPVSAATGFVQMLMNAGELRNQGVELYLGLTPVATRDFNWTVDANWSRNRANVVSFTEGVENIFLFGFTDPQIRIMEGRNGYGVIWSSGFRRADRERHAALFEQFPNLQEGQILIEENGLPLMAESLGPIGNVQPDWTANVRTGLSFRGVSVSGLVDIRQGGDVLNMDLYYASFYGTSASTGVRDTEFTYDGFNIGTGRPNDVAIMRNQAYFQGRYADIWEHFVEDGSFVKLREVTLAYAIPVQFAQRAGLQGATLSATGRNLWTATDFSYGDPEGSLAGTGNGQGFYHAVTPGTRSFSLGVRLTF